MKITTRKIVITAMLVAFDVIFTRVLALNVLTFKVGVGFAATALCAMMFGPIWGGAACAASDLIGSLLFPTGAYFPGFTATAAVTGIIFGLILGNGRPTALRCFLAALTNGVIVIMLLNTAMISLVFGVDFGPLFVTRLAEFGIMLALQTAVMTAICASDALYKRIEEYRNE